MAILDTVKKGYLTLKTATGYVKLLPRTLASLVSTSDGSDVQTKLDTINNNLTIYVMEERNISPKDNGTYQWRYRKWSNGTLELWRIGGNVDTITTSHESVNGVFYSDELVWYPFDLTDYVSVKEIYQVTGTIDRKGNTGLPQLNVIKCWAENGCAFIRFIITSNRSSEYKVSTNFYIQGRWK